MPDEVRQKIEGYLARLQAGLRGLNSDEAHEIVEELRREPCDERAVIGVEVVALPEAQARRDHALRFTDDVPDLVVLVDELLEDAEPLLAEPVPGEQIVPVGAPLPLLDVPGEPVRR